MSYPHFLHRYYQWGELFSVNNVTDNMLPCGTTWSWLWKNPDTAEATHTWKCLPVKNCNIKLSKWPMKPISLTLWNDSLTDNADIPTDDQQQSGSLVQTQKMVIISCFCSPSVRIQDPVDQFSLPNKYVTSCCIYNSKCPLSEESLSRLRIDVRLVWGDTHKITHYIQETHFVLKKLKQLQLFLVT